MNERKIYDALYSRFLEISEYHKISEKEKPVGDLPEVFLTEKFSPNTSASIGLAFNSSVKYEGYYIITINSPYGRGMDEIYAIGDKLFEYFKRGMKLDSQVLIETASLSTSFQSGDLMQTPFKIKYTAIMKG